MINRYVRASSLQNVLSLWRSAMVKQLELYSLSEMIFRRRCLARIFANWRREIRELNSNYSSAVESISGSRRKLHVFQCWRSAFQSSKGNTAAMGFSMSWSLRLHWKAWAEYVQTAKKLYIIRGRFQVQLLHETLRLWKWKVRNI